MDHSSRETVPPLGAYLEEKKGIVNDYLERLLAERYPVTDPKTHILSEAVAYSLMNGGKRIRPILTLAVGERYGRRSDGLLAVACATELVHTASIMLDDLPAMDDARERRGKPASHLVYGEATTILAAMALWNEAVRLLATVPGEGVRRVVQDATESIGGLIRGQFLDLDAVGKPQTIPDLEECSRLKTGMLFEHAMKIGALLAQAPPAEQAALARIGAGLGLIFQIRDDVLDAESTREALGKDVGLDARNGRTTYASLLGVVGAKRLLDDKIADACAELERLPEAPAVFIAIVQSLRVG